MLVFRWGLDPKIPVFDEQTKLSALEHTTIVIGLKVNGGWGHIFRFVK